MPTQDYFFVGAVILSGMYGLLIITFSISWVNIQVPKRQKYTPSLLITVIVPARNEEQHISNIMGDILAQDYPAELIEIFVMDDHSADSTFEKADFIKTSNPNRNISIIHLQDKPGIFAYKKRVIAEAIRNSSGDLIFTTDADCRLPVGWLSETVAFYETGGKPGMVIGPVQFDAGNTIFGKMQALEFISLIGVSGASAQIGIPLMCNGANLAYTRNAYMETGGFGSNERFASGDDVFLMLKIKNTFKNSIAFIKSNEATVTSYPQPTLSQLMAQRKRWSSKSAGYRDKAVISVAILVFVVNVLLAAYFVLSPFLSAGLYPFLFLFVIKSVPDFIFLWLVTSFFGIRKLLWWFLPMQFIYVFYVVLISLYGNIGKFYWKGRLVR